MTPFNSSVNEVIYTLISFNDMLTPSSQYIVGVIAATVTVYVLVAERTKPIFGPPWTPGNPWINATVPENIETGSTIVTFNAFDYIAGNNWVLIFTVSTAKLMV